MSGYIFNFSGHGAFDPNGKVSGEMTQAEIDAHNKALAEAEWQSMLKTGKALLYYSGKRGDYTLSTWDGSHKVIPHHCREHEHACYGRRVTRLDFWFSLAGAQWHGVNIGDNQLVRVRRNKS